MGTAVSNVLTAPSHQSGYAGTMEV